MDLKSIEYIKSVPGIPDVYAGTYLISVLAIVTTVLQFLSGTFIIGITLICVIYPHLRLVCKQYVKNQTTAEASALPFLLGVSSCGVWLLYGLTLNDNTIILVNTIGFVLMTIYTVIFYIYTMKKSSLTKQFSLIVGLLIFTTLYVHVELDTDKVINRLGLLACSLTLLTVASPMSKLFYVMKVKNTECLPFPMILMSFFVSLLWFIYGVLASDPYLMLSNAIGAVLAVSQLSLFVLYPRRPAAQGLSKSILA